MPARSGGDRQPAASGQCRLELGDAAKATAACDEALRLDEKHVAGLVLRARAHLAAGRYEAAETDLVGAVAMGGPSASALVYRGIARMHLEHLAAAESDFGKSIELDRNNALAFWHRAAVRERLERSSEAAADRARARELDPALGLADSSAGRSLLQVLPGRGSADELDPRLK